MIEESTRAVLFCRERKILYQTLLSEPPSLLRFGVKQFKARNSYARPQSSSLVGIRFCFMAAKTSLGDYREDAWVDRDDIPLKQSGTESEEDEKQEYPPNSKLVPILIGLCFQSFCIALVSSQPRWICQLANRCPSCRTIQFSQRLCQR